MIDMDEVRIIFDIWKLRGSGADVSEYISAIKNYRAEKEKLRSGDKIQMDKA